MLKRIEVKNFKSLKHIDFKCAGLNLLMGMNGAGKSSFVELIRFLSKAANKENPLEVKEIVPGRFNDLRYCYGNAKTPIEVKVDYNSKFASEKDCDYTLRRTFLPGQNKNEMVIVHSESFAIDEKLRKWEERLESQHGGQMGLLQVQNEDIKLWEKYQTEADRIIQEADAAKKKSTAIP